MKQYGSVDEVKKAAGHIVLQAYDNCQELREALQFERLSPNEKEQLDAAVHEIQFALDIAFCDIFGGADIERWPNTTTK